MKNKHARVMVLVHDVSSECALQMYEVSLRYLLRLSSYRGDTFFVKDRQTDGQTGKRNGENNMPANPSRGGGGASFLDYIWNS